MKARAKGFDQSAFRIDFFDADIKIPETKLQGLFTIYKNIPEILVGNFRSIRTVRIVYHLPKISGLSRRARLDSSYNMKWYETQEICKW